MQQNLLDSSTERTPAQLGQEQPCACGRDGSRRDERYPARYLDGDLQFVNDQWEGLPADVRSTVVAIIRSAKDSQHKCDG
jgi:hypothetical protein